MALISAGVLAYRRIGGTFQFLLGCHAAPGNAGSLILVKDVWVGRATMSEAGREPYVADQHQGCAKQIPRNPAWMGRVGRLPLCGRVRPGAGVPRTPAGVPGAAKSEGQGPGAVLR